MPKKKLKILPLGGLGEIGMNCMVLEYGDDMVLLDCGIQFPDLNYPGADLLTPDLTYVQERLKNLRGIVVTHGHDDHIGAIPFLSMSTPLDIYCTPFPQGLIRNKMVEYPHTKEIRYHDISPRKTFKVGPFTFDPIPVQHSIIEALAFGIETPLGNIVHSGDFKHDPKDADADAHSFDPFFEWGKKGVLLLMSDSTNAERPGHTLSEKEIAKSFETIFAEQSQRLLIALFASNIRRIENLLHVAKSLGKKVAFAGRSMHSYTRLAHEQGSIKVPEDTLVLLEDLHRHPDDKVIVMLTGSQAEPQSALVRIATGSHKFFQLKPGDHIIMSSRFIPGNERNINNMIDSLYRLGAEVTYEAMHKIHVSGHGYQDELMLMLEATKPKFFIPIHGEYRHLSKHSKLAVKSGVDPDNICIIEDGQGVEFDEKGYKRLEKIEINKGIIVSGDFMEAGPLLFNQRINLAKTGIVYLSIMRDKKTLKLLSTPSVSAYGLMYRKNVNARDALLDAEDYVEELYPDLLRKPDLEETLRVEMRRFFKKKVSHKPVVVPIVLDI